MKFTYDVRSQERLDFFLYHIVFEEILEVTTKKKMKRKTQRIVETEQVLRKDT